MRDASTTPDAIFGAVLARIEPELRAKIEILLARERAAHFALQGLDLLPYEEPEYVGQDLAMWEEIAGPLRTVLLGLNDVRDALRALKTEEADGSSEGEIDIAFDLAEPAPAEPVRDRMNYDIDLLIESALSPERTAEAQVADALLPLGEMMRIELGRFGDRFRNPTVIADRWNLLSELQEFKGKFQKLLMAVRLAAIHRYSDEQERQSLVDYRTELDTSLVIRCAIYLLRRDVVALVQAYLGDEQINGVRATVSNEVRSFILQELFVRLLRFSRHAGYTHLRAPDKRQVIEFRKALALVLGASEPAATHRADELLEGFVRFLDAMQSISKREVLLAHDQRLVAALRLEAQQLKMIAEASPATLVKSLRELRLHAAPVLGLIPELNAWLMAHVVDDIADPEVSMHWVLAALR